jgi:hypothetical protein
MNRKPIVIPANRQEWRMQTLGRDGILLDVVVTIDWAYVQNLARRAHANKTRRSTDGPIYVKAVRS